ncbi:MAG: hypothetical protein ACP5QO_01120 [Clostridia bacterium]
MSRQDVPHPHGVQHACPIFPDRVWAVIDHWTPSRFKGEPPI